MQLQNKKLFKEQAYIDGQWVSGTKNFAVTNPADGAQVATVPDLGIQETKTAIEAARKALPGWAALSAKERAAILRRWADLVVEHANDLAALMVAEQGKPFAEARGEILYGAAFLEWFAE